jgi:hypothetical protein
MDSKSLDDLTIEQLAALPKWAVPPRLQKKVEEAMAADNRARSRSMFTGVGPAILMQPLRRVGPFGLWMGMKLQDLAVESEEVAAFKYRIVSPPRPHSAFSDYVLQVAPTAGLCWIKAIGTTIKAGSFGTDLKSKFDEMEQKLLKSYGSFTRTDQLMPGSIWNEPRDWMAGLRSKERYLFSRWDHESGALLQNGLKAVFLGATAFDSDSGFIYVEYFFVNDVRGEAEIASMEDDAL